MTCENLFPFFRRSFQSLTTLVEWKQGIFFVRWSPRWGWGSPLRELALLQFIRYKFVTSLSVTSLYGTCLRWYSIDLLPQMVRPYFRYRETCHFCGQDCTVSFFVINSFGLVQSYRRWSSQSQWPHLAGDIWPVKWLHVSTLWSGVKIIYVFWSCLYFNLPLMVRGLKPYI